MKFWEIFRFEFSYQIRRPWTWLFILVLLVLNFLMTRDGSVAEVLYSDFLLNSPFNIAKTTVFGGLIWLVMCAAISGDAAARDLAVGIHPLSYTVHLSKASYLGGRFLAAFALNALMLLSIQVAIILAVYLPGVHPELIGPFRPKAFLTSYAYLALPNAFVASAIQFLLAERSGRAMSAYFASFLIVFMGFFVAALLLYTRGLGTLLDPIGIRLVVEDIARMWTPAEKNSRLLELSGTFLINRLFWIGIGVIALAATYLSFRFNHRTGNNWLARLVDGSFGEKKQYSITQERIRAFPETVRGHYKLPIRRFGAAFHARQTIAIALTSLRTLMFSWAGLAMLIGIPLITIPVVIDQMSSNDVPLIPSTIRVIAELTGPLSDELSRWVIIPFLIMYFAGELMWRERDAGLGEIVDAMPGSEWPPFLGKLLGLILMLVLFTALQMGAAILAQRILEYDHYEIGLYVKILFGLQLTDYILIAVLALTAHVVVNQKYLAHLVAVLTFVFIVLSPLFGVEHNLLVYGTGPLWSYTEMRGFGLSLGPWLWFKAYWAAWALLLAVVARLLWVRGKEITASARMRLAQRRFAGATLWTATIAIVSIVLLGGFIFYNTNVLNEYYSNDAWKQLAAEYERRYGKYAEALQPDVSYTKLNINIYPEQHVLTIQGKYTLVNRTGSAIDSIHVATVPGVETMSIAFDKPKTRVLEDDNLYHRIYILERALQPGDSMTLDFEMHAEPRGFRENGIDAVVLDNGTRFSNNLLPSIGYKQSRELLAPADRRDFGLPERTVIPSLNNVSARKKRTEGTVLETIISTTEDQTGVAPGMHLNSWKEKGRSYFHYKTDGAIGDEWSFFSARYHVEEIDWRNSEASGKPVKIKIFHHPTHTAYLPRVIRSIKASLDYYSREFGPYRYGHLTVVEYPGLGEGMHADPSMITHQEGFTSWNPKEGVHDHPYAIVTHEMAHQWTVPSAPVEGAPIMSESIAWYYGMKAVEHTKGVGDLQKLLHFMRQPYPYPAIRRGEPLMRGLDPYLSYRRGPFALYTLSEYVGEEKVNRALRNLLENHLPKNAQLATTLDLYAELKAVTPDSLQYLLHDLFEVNTYWELAVENVDAKQSHDGNWQITIDLKSRKVAHDSAGVQCIIPLNDWIEIGAYRDTNDRKHETLYEKKHYIHSERETILITLPHKPDRVYVDPNRLLIDLDFEDNVSIIDDGSKIAI
jgi:ABC-2 type transport system permease protein